MRYSISEKCHAYLFSFCIWRSVYFLDRFSVSGGVCMCKWLCCAVVAQTNTAQARILELHCMTGWQGDSEPVVCLEDQGGGSLLQQRKNPHSTSACKCLPALWLIVLWSFLPLMHRSPVDNPFAFTSSPFYTDFIFQESIVLPAAHGPCGHCGSGKSFSEWAPVSRLILSHYTLKSVFVPIDSPNT